MQPDEFFGVFDSFIMSMADAKEENERIKKQREEEERRAQLEEKVRNFCNFPKSSDTQNIYCNHSKI